jgi:hypothetical protein
MSTCDVEDNRQLRLDGLATSSPGQLLVVIDMRGKKGLLLDGHESIHCAKRAGKIGSQALARIKLQRL